jgi:hypothetical protein
MPQSDQSVQLNAQDVVNAYLQQILTLSRRNAELEAMVAMQQRMLAAPDVEAKAAGGD